MSNLGSGAGGIRSVRVEGQAGQVGASAGAVLSRIRSRFAGTGPDEAVALYGRPRMACVNTRWASQVLSPGRHYAS